MTPVLYRKRLIPNETVKLTNDKIIFCSEKIIITSWKPIRPRSDIGSGESCYIIEKGIKASRFYDTNGAFIYWYFDIIKTEHNEETNEYVFTDMLADVVVYPDGLVKVLDIDELTDMREQGIISEEMLLECLKKLAHLLDIVNNRRTSLEFGKFFENLG